MQTCYSENGEDFTRDRESVLEKMAENGLLKVGEEYYEADSVPLAVGKLLSADDILERADEIGYDLIGESWGNPCSVGRDAMAELQNALDAWAEKHVELAGYWELVGKTRTARITEADMTANGG